MFQPSSGSKSKPMGEAATAHISNSKIPIGIISRLSSFSGPTAGSSSMPTLAVIDQGKGRMLVWHSYLDDNGWIVAMLTAGKPAVAPDEAGHRTVPACGCPF